MFKNVFTCTICPILQNGLHVDEILIKKNSSYWGLKICLCIVKLCML
jgi:hypothetical protein